MMNSHENFCETEGASSPLDDASVDADDDDSSSIVGAGIVTDHLQFDLDHDSVEEEVEEDSLGLLVAPGLNTSKHSVLNWLEEASPCVSTMSALSQAVSLNFGAQNNASQVSLDHDVFVTAKSELSGHSPSKAPPGASPAQDQSDLIELPSVGESGCSGNEEGRVAKVRAENTSSSWNPAGSGEGGGQTSASDDRGNGAHEWDFKAIPHVLLKFVRFLQTVDGFLSGEIEMSKADLQSEVESVTDALLNNCDLFIRIAQLAKQPATTDKTNNNNNNASYHSIGSSKRSKSVSGQSRSKRRIRKLVSSAEEDERGEETCPNDRLPIAESSRLLEKPMEEEEEEGEEEETVGRKAHGRSRKPSAKTSRLMEAKRAANKELDEEEEECTKVENNGSERGKEASPSDRLPVAESSRLSEKPMEEEEEEETVGRKAHGRSRKSSAKTSRLMEAKKTANKEVDEEEECGSVAHNDSERKKEDVNDRLLIIELSRLHGEPIDEEEEEKEDIVGRKARTRLRKSSAGTSVVMEAKNTANKDLDEEEKEEERGSVKNNSGDKAEETDAIETLIAVELNRLHGGPMEEKEEEKEVGRKARGRPRKSSAGTSVGMEATKTANKESDAEDREESEKETIKKKLRGRPRRSSAQNAFFDGAKKAAKEEEEDDQYKTETNKSRRKSQRPKKMSINCVANKATEEPEDDEEEETLSPPPAQAPQMKVRGTPNAKRVSRCPLSAEVPRAKVTNGRMPVTADAEKKKRRKTDVAGVTEAEASSDGQVVRRRESTRIRHPPKFCFAGEVYNRDPSGYMTLVVDDDEEEEKKEEERAAPQPVKPAGKKRKRLPSNKGERRSEKARKKRKSEQEEKAMEEDVQSESKQAPKPQQRKRLLFNPETWLASFKASSSNSTLE